MAGQKSEGVERFSAGGFLLAEGPGHGLVWRGVV